MAEPLATAKGLGMRRIQIEVNWIVHPGVVSLEMMMSAPHGSGHLTSASRQRYQANYRNDQSGESMYQGPIIDCDVHHARATDEELFPYLSRGWRNFITDRGRAGTMP